MVNVSYTNVSTLKKEKKEKLHWGDRHCHRESES